MLCWAIGDAMTTTLQRRRKTSAPIFIPSDADLTLDLSRGVKPPRPAFNVEVQQFNNKYIVTLSDNHLYLERCEANFSPSQLSDEYKSISQSARITLMGDQSEISELADRSYFLFCNIFTKKRMRDTIRRIMLNFDESSPQFCLIISDCISLPWSLLYTEKPEKETIDVSFFWGARCTPVCNISDLHKDTSPILPEMGAPIRVLAAYCDILEYTVSHEIPMIKRHANSERVPALVHCDDFPELIGKDGRPTPESNSTARRALFGATQEMIHFACHGSSWGDASSNALRIRNGYLLSHKALVKEDEKFKGNPLLFLNACDIGIIDPLKLTGLISLLLDNNARTVIAPTCEISDQNSARFARSFYKYFILNKQNVTEAIFEASRDVYHKFGDLIGLAYQVYGQVDARIAPGDSE